MIRCSRSFPNEYYTFAWIFPLIVFSCIPSFGQDSVKPQSPAEKKNQANDIRDLENRVKRLEDRLKRIEDVLFASIKYSEAEAKKRLEEAQADLAQSEKLYAKGLLSSLQLMVDRSNAERAQLLMRLCLEKVDQRIIGAQLDWYDAQSNLQRRKLQLDRTKMFFEKGLIARQHLQKDDLAVKNASKQLEAAQQKLKALKKSTNN